MADLLETLFSTNVRCSHHPVLTDRQKENGSKYIIDQTKCNPTWLQKELQTERNIESNKYVYITRPESYLNIII